LCYTGKVSAGAKCNWLLRTEIGFAASRDADSISTRVKLTPRLFLFLLFNSKITF
jgi:hypothetical protein